MTFDEWLEYGRTAGVFSIPSCDSEQPEIRRALEACWIAAQEDVSLSIKFERSKPGEIIVGFQLKNS